MVRSGPRRSRVPDVLTGVLLVNTLPHIVRGIAGRRGLTPFGADSSPGVNLAWAGVNGGAAAGLIVAGGWRRIDDATAAGRLVSAAAGGFGMATFAMVYELTAGRRERSEPAGKSGE